MIDKEDAEKSQRFHIEQRKRGRERLIDRKMERKMLTFKSNQPGLDLEEIKQIGNIDLEAQNQEFMNEITTKRSNTNKQRDPEHCSTNRSDTDFNSPRRLKNSSKKTVRTVINDYIMMKDQQACIHILNNINHQR